MEPQGDADTPTPDTPGTPRHPPAGPEDGGAAGAVGKQQLGPAGGTLGQRGAMGVTARGRGQMGTKGGTPGRVRMGGVTPREQETQGGTPRQLRMGGLTPREQGTQGGTPRQLRMRGVTPKEQGTQGGTPRHLRMGGPGGALGGRHRRSWGQQQRAAPGAGRTPPGCRTRRTSCGPSSPPARPRGGPPAPHPPCPPTSPVVSPVSPTSPTVGATEGSGGSERGAPAGGPRGRVPPGRPRPEGAGGRPRASARAQGRSAILEKFGGAATGPAPHLKRSGGTAAVKAMLLEWCRSRTRGYQHVEVQNFSGSWGSGLAFCALLHSFFPDAFDYGSLEPGARRHNFALAFATAEERAGCAPLLEVEDMVRLPVPDAKCVYTYLQELYRCLVAKGLVKTKKR
ncbi:unnamed protein product [Bubo scandiacus]